MYQDGQYLQQCIFNSRIKEVIAKPIITLLEEVRMYAMRTIARNKRSSRLEKIRNESKSWNSVWSGDEKYEKFEVICHPTNMVVDLEEGLCSCDFWQLSGCLVSMLVLRWIGSKNVLMNFATSGGQWIHIMTHMHSI
ncbi:hypothetical protein Ahy_B01g052569 [Arachis hypogaea]|uniref:Uncharacterized protein n=1 Tax=Arachis hypogaea TaxID=3818 RepID=A0A445APT1_ARAHY|nr:hypothetical protein Ahy_B01g052569 [Arachis hypogaea]